MQHERAGSPSFVEKSQTFMTINGSGSVKRPTQRSEQHNSDHQPKVSSKGKSDNAVINLKNEAQTDCQLNPKNTSRLKMLEILRQTQKQFETQHKLQIICFGSYVDKSSKQSILSATSRLNTIKNKVEGKGTGSAEIDKFRTQIDPSNLQRSMDNIFRDSEM